jgi:hypothetical protein
MESEKERKKKKQKKSQIRRVASIKRQAKQIDRKRKCR